MRAFVLDGEVVRRTESHDEVKAAFAANKRVWVDLGEETPASRAMMIDVFGIHPLAVEDVWADCESPKAEDYGGYVHIIVHSVRQDGRADFDLVELDVVLGKEFVITHTRDEKVVAAVAEELQRSPRLLKKGCAWIAHDLIDRLVDDYMPLLDRYDEELTSLEAEVVVHAGTKRGPRVMKRIFAMKRAIMNLRRNTIHQREILLRLSRAEFDEIPPEAMPFFRDVYDHFVRVTDLADSYRELLTSALEAFLSVQSNRMNEIMKTLTLISTVMLPLTFIAGVYGMNFEHMPELKWQNGYPFALTLMAVTALGILYFFRRKKWL
jgi:magnesium transporter